MNIKSLIILLSLLTSAEASAWTYGDGDEIRYGNRYGNDSNSVKLYSPGGEYMGNLNDNQFDPNSVSNPFGRYGSKYSSDSINNPYGKHNSYYLPWW